MLLKVSPLILTIWIIYLERLRCALVIDNADQKDDKLEPYCKQFKTCAEGTHVACMYYDRNKLGPLCHGVQIINLTNEFQDVILDKVNKIRAEVALGNARGQGFVFLPRAYGLYKLKWDPELGYLARIMSHTCQKKKDLCRATMRFDDPGQQIGYVRFTLDSWQPLKGRINFTTNGFNDERVIYALNATIDAWSKMSEYVTPSMITKIPDWQKYAANTLSAKPYLYTQMVQGNTTHMGCGFIGYVDYYHGVDGRYMVNAILIHCNFSHRDRPGLPLYRTKNERPKNGTEPKIPCAKGAKCTSRVIVPFDECGCANGSDTETCLCENRKPAQRCDDQDCNPAVVLLPIFTVEDEPVHKAERQGEVALSKALYAGRAAQSRWGQSEMVHSLAPIINHSALRNGYNNMYQEPFTPLNQQYSYASSISQSNKRYPEVKSHYFDSGHAKNSLMQQSINYVRRNTRNHGLPKQKTSIFSRAPKFELPGTAVMVRSRSLAQPNTNEHQYRGSSIKMDVAPRRDFSKSEQLLNMYLNGKRQHIPVTYKAKYNHRGPIVKPRFKNKAIVKPIVKHKKPFGKNFYVNKTLTSKKNVNRYLKNKFHYQGFGSMDEHVKGVDEKIFNEEADKKLMSLLDTLEQEVKHIELDVNEKEIFDAKIRKIYGKVVGKFPMSLTPRFKEAEEDKKELKQYDVDLSDPVLENIEDPNKKVLDQQIYETEDMVKKLHSKGHSVFNTGKSIYVEPLPRNQNSLIPFDDKEMEPSDPIKNTFGDEEQLKPRHVSKNHNNNDNHNNAIKNRTPDDTFGDEEQFKPRHVSKNHNNNDNHNNAIKNRTPDHHKERNEHKNEITHIFKHIEEKNHEEAIPRFPVMNEEIDKREELPMFQYKNPDQNNRNQNKAHFYEQKSRHVKQIEEPVKYKDERNQNHIDDYDFKEVKTKSMYNEAKKRFSDYESDKDDGEDPLSADRRKFYQEKLDDLEKKLRTEHLSRHRNGHGDHETERARRLLHGRDRMQQQLRPSHPKESSHFYVPDRARSLHGF